MGKQKRGVRMQVTSPKSRAESPQTQAQYHPDEEGDDQHPTCDLSPETALWTRRNFLKLGMGALGVIAALEAGGASLLYLRSHSLKGVFGSLVTAGAIEDFPPGSVTEFADARFFLVRTEDDGFLAVHSRCPHLGCTVTFDAEKNQFLCPCHASKFDIYGDHGNPPVTRALDTFAVSFKDGYIEVDTTQRSERNTFTPDQLARV